MRTFFMSLFVLAGLAIASAVPASANAVSGLIAKPAVQTESQVDQVTFRHHRRHGGLFLGFGYPAYYGYNSYPRYRYYDDYSDYRPRYRYRSYRHHRHHRHYRHW